MLSAREVREWLHYDPSTGIFYWRKQPNQRIKIGTVVGTRATGGYWRIRVLRHSYAAHRLAWLYMHGRWPTKQIDHINLNPADNSFANLREASDTQNKVNRIYPNSNGFRGVQRTKSGKRFFATVRWRDSRGLRARRHLGTFDTPEEAHEAYMRATRKIHGEFVRSESSGRLPSLSP